MEDRFGGYVRGGIGVVDALDLDQARLGVDGVPTTLIAQVTTPNGEAVSDLVPDITKITPLVPGGLPRPLFPLTVKIDSWLDRTIRQPIAHLSWPRQFDVEMEMGKFLLDVYWEGC